MDVDDKREGFVAMVEGFVEMVCSAPADED